MVMLKTMLMVMEVMLLVMEVMFNGDDDGYGGGGHGNDADIVMTLMMGRILSIYILHPSCH